MIYDRVSAQFVLGFLLNNPTILYNIRYKLNRNDFKPVLFHYYLFACIENIAESGVQEIDRDVITAFLNSTDKYKTQKEVLEDNDYAEFIDTFKDLVKDSDNSFDYYYTSMRKYSLVREYQNKGFDITDIYDESKDEESQREHLNNLSIDEILAHFEKIQKDLESEYSKEAPIEESWAGKNVNEMLEMFEETPSFGASFNSPYLTTVGGGWNRGHLIMRSAPSGGNKTTQAIADLCLMGTKELYDPQEHKFMPNPNYQGKCFYIHTEQKQFEEIQPRFLSYVANVECYRIMTNDINDKEKERVRKAGEILQDSGMRLINLPKFTMQSIREIIKSMVLQYGCTYGVFDYIFDNTYCMAEYRTKVGNSARQDMMFLAVATELKDIAEEFDVGLMTMTQLNGKEKTLDVIDESCIFGSTQMKNKLDIGMITMIPKKKELELLAPLYEDNKFGKKIDINMVTNVYKARYNRYGKALRIWQHLNRSTGRVEDYFCTDVDNEPVQIDRTVLDNLNLI